MLHFAGHYILFMSLLFVASEKRIRIKRSDIDLPTCIDKFNVHKDKIIRTEDSQNMGAKYLNELDLGSREECLHLCCETKNCDVFVFEEKNSGSCYLFQCGPPEDFKCKFTHHVNYSSAILSINKHLPDLESQIKLTKHEQDLNKLRKADINSEPPSTTTTAVSPIREIIPPSQKNSRPAEEESRCTRFQFECRSNKECIAIYNACDGIPQCADASDEGPELGCPDSAITAATTLTIAPARVNNVPTLLQVRYDANMQQQQQQQQQLPQIPLVPQTVYLQPPHDPPQLLSPSLQRESEEYVRPGNGGQPTNINNVPLQYETPLRSYVPQLSAVQGQSNWIPRQTNPMPPQIPQYAERASRIFNHKESGFQVPDGQEISQVPASYPKIGKYFPENGYRKQIQQENWPSDDGVYEQTNVQQEIVQNSGQNIANQETRTPNIIRNNVINPKHVQEQLAHDLKHSKDNMEHADSNLKISTTHVSDQGLHYTDVVSYKFSGANDPEDGVAHTQKGAVLAVSLGLIITFLMAVMIGCRLKMVRRKIRKGGKSYAHDADFLVNGMYL